MAEPPTSPPAGLPGPVRQCQPKICHEQRERPANMTTVSGIGSLQPRS